MHIGNLTRSFFLVPILPQSFLSLMCSNLVPFPLLTTWHKALFLNVFNILNVCIECILQSRIIHKLLANLKMFQRLLFVPGTEIGLS